LTRYLLEESYEVVDAIEALPVDDVEPVDRAAYVALADELGDLLFQVVFHGVLAEEADAFSLADVAQGIHAKLVRRHPHVFGDVEAATAGEVIRNWEQIKKDERGSDSLVDGIPAGLPALLYTHKLFRKAASVGLDPGDRRSASQMLAWAVDAAARDDATDRERLVGEVLAAAVILARDTGIDAESALRGWAARYRAHFQRMEEAARARGLALESLDPDEVDALWRDTATPAP
jgi:MazG family protein